MNYHPVTGAASESLPLDNIFSRLVAMGYSPMPIVPGDKMPGVYSAGFWDKMCKWGVRCDTAAAPETIAMWASWPGAGVAVACGYNGLCAIDIDSEDQAVIEAVESILPKSPVRKRGSRGYTAYYRGDVSKVVNAQIGLDQGGGVDILARGGATVIPPSIHKTPGVGAYRWLTVDTLEHLSCEYLPWLPDDIKARLIEVLKPFGAEDYDEEPRERVIGGSDSIWREVNREALSRPSEWVPKLGPKFRREGASFRLQAEWRGGDGYNVSVHKRGIKDFARGERMSAIDLVMAALDTKDYQALNWLKDKLGIVEPEAKSEPSAETTASAAKTPEQKQTNNDAPTEDAVASSFAEQRGGDLKFCHHAGRWYEWFGGVWRVNETGIVLQRIRELSRAMSSDAGPKIQAAVNKVSFSRGAESFCKVDPTFAVTSDHWDKDQMLLGTPDGTVDLRTGDLRESDPADGITKSAAVSPAKIATCPTWLRFLREATGGDVEMTRFLQQWCGYALTGDVREHAFVFVYGPGGNGKSVWLNTIAGIMGDYHAVAPMEALTESFNERHPTDLAGLRGSRLVTAIETEEGKAWAEAKLKSLTGGDPIKARFMRQDFFTYQPQFKLTVAGNHKPTLRNVDAAMKRRINIVPFEHTPVEPDRQLEEKLKAEWPMILRWAIDGCIDWQKHGLIRPVSITAATGNYFEAQNIFKQWLEEECVYEPKNTYRTAKARELFASWTAYAKAAGVPAGGVVKFAESLHGAGCVNVKSTGGVRSWCGVELRRAPCRNGDDSF